MFAIEKHLPRYPLLYYYGNLLSLDWIKNCVKKLKIKVNENLKTAEKKEENLKNKNW